MPKLQIVHLESTRNTTNNTCRKHRALHLSGRMIQLSGYQWTPRTTRAKWKTMAMWEYRWISCQFTMQRRTRWDLLERSQTLIHSCHHQLVDSRSLLILAKCSTSSWGQRCAEKSTAMDVLSSVSWSAFFWPSTSYLQLLVQSLRQSSLENYHAVIIEFG